MFIKLGLPETDSSINSATCQSITTIKSLGPNLYNKLKKKSLFLIGNQTRLLYTSFL